MYYVMKVDTEETVAMTRDAEVAEMISIMVDVECVIRKSDKQEVRGMRCRIFENNIYNVMLIPELNIQSWLEHGQDESEADEYPLGDEKSVVETLLADGFKEV